MHLILSRRGEPKTRRIVEKIKQNINLGKVSYLMVPEQFTLQTELFLMEALAVEALIDVKVMSFERLSRQVLKRHGGYKRAVIDEVGKHMALRRVFEEKSEQINLYQRAFQSAGFVGELSHTISELKKMAVDGQQLVERSKETADPLLRYKLYEIGTLYQGLEEYMRGRYVDNDDRIGLLGEKISLAQDLKQVEFFFDSFSGFTVLEMQVIGQLCRMGVRVNIGLALDEQDQTRVFDKTKWTAGQLCRLDQIDGYATTKEVVSEEDSRDPVLSFLDHHLYDYGQRPFSFDKIPESVKVYEALTMEEEISQTAKEILRLVRQQGYRYKEILVVTSLPEAYGSKIKRIFSKYKIPHFVDIKRDILSSGLMGMVFSLMDMILYHLSYEEVFRFLKSGFSDLEEETCHHLENFCLKWGIQGGRWLQDKFFEEDKYFEEGEDIQAIQKGRDYLRRIYDRAKQELERPLPGKEFCRRLFDMLTEMQVMEKNHQFITHLREIGEEDYANEGIQLWNVLLSTMDQLVEILGDQVMSLREFRDILEEGIAGQKVGVIPPMGDQIIIATMDRSRSSEVKVLFFLGANDGYVPRVMEDSPILGEEDKTRLKELGIELPSELKNKTAEDDFAIYSLIAKPKDRLYLSYSLSDADGKTLRHAQLIDRVRFLLPDLSIEGKFDRKDQPVFVEQNILSPELTFEQLKEQIRNHESGQPMDPNWFSVFDWFYRRSDDSWKDHTKMLLEGLCYENQVVPLNATTASRLYEPLRVSASRMEKFAGCPFAHFLQYGLKPTERKVYQIDPLELGTIFHGAVEKFGKAIEDPDTLARVTDEKASDQLMEALVEESLTSGVKTLMEHSARDAYMLTKVKKIAKRAGRTMVTHKNKGEFVSFGQEVEIRSSGLMLANGQQIPVKALVDQVDILTEGDNTYVKVIDYKSGEKPFDLSDVYDGINIQLIFYLNLVLELLRGKYGKKVIPAGAFYFYLKDVRIPTEEEDEIEIQSEIDKKLRLEGVILNEMRMLKAMDRDMAERLTVVNAKMKAGQLTGDSALSVEEFDGLMNRVDQEMTRLANQMVEGNIHIAPYRKKGKTPCDYCRYGAICKFDEKTGNEYRRLRRRTGEEVLNLLKKQDKKETGEGAGSDGMDR